MLNKVCLAGMVLAILFVLPAGAVPSDGTFPSVTRAAELPTCDNGTAVVEPGCPPLFPTDSVYWSFRDSITEGLTRTAGVVDPDGWIRVVCGNTMAVDTSYKYQQLFDPTTNTWFVDMAISHPGNGVHNHDVEIIGDTIYVGWGSNKAAYYNNLTMIDLIGYTWTVVGAAPAANLLYYEFAVCNGMLYCFGGAPSGGTPVNAARKFNPATKTWSNIANMPAVRRDPAAATVGDTIYVFGGFSTGTTAVTTCYAYNTIANTWRTLAAMPQATGWATAHVIEHPDSGAFIYVCGGENGGTCANRVMRYRVATNSWTTESPMQRVRRSHVGAVLGPCSLFVAAGYSGARPFLRSVETGMLSGLVGIEEERGPALGSRLSVRPNPCRSRCVVSGLVPGARVTLYDVDGREAPARGGELDLSGLRPGVYVVKVQTGGETRTVRLVKAD